jgi:hypothetical protein
MEPLNTDDRSQLARLIVALLDEWGLSAADQVALLSLPEGTRSGAIRQHRQGAPFPADATVAERIEHLIGIADALRTTYPRNIHMGAIWVNTVNHRFDNRTPLAAMLADGLNGLLAVRVLLDCAYDWNLSGSSRPSA